MIPTLQCTSSSKMNAFWTMGIHKRRPVSIRDNLLCKAKLAGRIYLWLKGNRRFLKETSKRRVSMISSFSNRTLMAIGLSNVDNGDKFDISMGRRSNALI